MNTCLRHEGFEVLELGAVVGASRGHFSWTVSYSLGVDPACLQVGKWGDGKRCFTRGVVYCGAVDFSGPMGMTTPGG